ncbi:unnamed protein product [Brugia pahangi]|uniref:Uncharacterized protein n=1 Tax=Brugia pahangi TaxID=6280 RepID=A0A0N4TV06_BRUPA|nr:unnamed protein product [Brugia pahangi]
MYLSPSRKHELRKKASRNHALQKDISRTHAPDKDVSRKSRKQALHKETLCDTLRDCMLRKHELHRDTSRKRVLHKDASRERVLHKDALRSFALFFFATEI